MLALLFDLIQPGAVDGWEVEDKLAISDPYQWRVVLSYCITALLTEVLMARFTVGQTGSNAKGVGTSTLLGATLVEQVLTMNLESPRL